MGNIRYLFESVLLLMKHEFTIYGYTISFFKIFLVSILIGFAGTALGKIFGGD